MQIVGIFLGIALTFFNNGVFADQKVEIKNNRLHVGSNPEPFLFGAELQYFRLRAGHGANIPADKVYQLWESALGQMRRAGMNSLSFYIPWDFHEYREGKFDFKGTVDEDQDGNPDYPSRNVVYFIELARKYGFNRIMVRPGPYINAEWGFLGFGAIPLWFHEKYPDSHMRNPFGRRTKLYDYHNQDLLRLTKKWFQAVYDQVLKVNLGDDSPIVFLQLDNETNFMWQSIYNHDYSQASMDRYRKYLADEYLVIGKINEIHGRNYQDWNEVFPPVKPGNNIAEDADWYRFNDWSIFAYLKEIRKMWEAIGIHEPQLLFTLAESYNATENGLLPNFKLRSWPGKTGMITVNLYPKTYESGQLLNLPFKSDIDVKSMVQANKFYVGNQEWLLGPEIQGGWWRGIGVSEAARTQTYLTTIGHGLKALYVYYFTEGQNWQHDWAYHQIRPIFDRLLADQGFEWVPSGQLPDSFWEELQNRVDDNILVGFNAKGIILDGPNAGADLYFDAPLDAEANPRPHFHILEDIGKKVAQPFGDFLAGAIEVSDKIGLFKDVNCHAPSRAGQKDNVLLNSDWAGGLLGFLLQAGYNPLVLHAHLLNEKSLKDLKIIFRQDCGVSSHFLSSQLKNYVSQGGVLVNFAEQTFLDEIKSQAPLLCETKEFSALKLQWQVCTLGKGFILQVKDPFYSRVNSDDYASLTKMIDYQRWMKAEIPASWPDPRLSIVGGGDRTVVFGRISPSKKGLWITVKTGQKAKQAVAFRISSETLAAAGLAHSKLTVHNVLSGEKMKQLINKSGDIIVNIDLQSEDSKALFVSQEL
ncbi:MAG: beta-galactosidase [Bdellovibrionales bacterium]|nr:beta-galactosidase [Bdellovibrionales bacterium]